MKLLFCITFISEEETRNEESRRKITRGKSDKDKNNQEVVILSLVEKILCCYCISFYAFNLAILLLAFLAGCSFSKVRKTFKILLK